MRTMPKSMILVIAALTGLAGCDMFLPDAGGYNQRCLAGGEQVCKVDLVATEDQSGCWCLDPDGPRCSSNQDCKNDRESECIDGHCKPCTGPEACTHIGFGNCLIDPNSIEAAYCVGCLTPADCAPGETCEANSHSCDGKSTACSDDTDCEGSPGPKCYQAQGVCGPCQADAECASFEFERFCVSGACRMCRTEADCPMNQTCQAGVCETMCSVQGDCNSYPEAPVCNHQGFCGECAEDQDCESLPQHPQHCLQFWGRCADCNQDSDCADGLHCKDKRTCVDCVSDEDCPETNNCYAGFCTACTPGTAQTCANEETCVGGVCLSGLLVPVPRQTGAVPDPVGNLSFGSTIAHPTLLAYGHRGQAGGVYRWSSLDSLNKVSGLISSGVCQSALVSACATDPHFRPGNPDGQVLLGIPETQSENIQPREYWLYNAADSFVANLASETGMLRMTYLQDGLQLVSLDTANNGDLTVTPQLVYRDLNTLAALGDPAPLDLALSAHLQDLRSFALAAGADGSQLAASYRGIDQNGGPAEVEGLELIDGGLALPIDLCQDTSPACGRRAYALAFSPAESGPSRYLAAGGAIVADGVDYDQGWLGLIDLGDANNLIYMRTLRLDSGENSWTHTVQALRFIDDKTLLVLTREGRLRVLIHTATEPASWVFSGNADAFGYTSDMEISDTPAAGLVYDPLGGWVALGGSDEVKFFDLATFLKEGIGFGQRCSLPGDCSSAFPLCAQPYGIDSFSMCTRTCDSDKDCRTNTVFGRCLDWSGDPLCTVAY